MVVHTFANLLQQGEASGDTQPFDEPNKDDIYMLSYTSGTTGDPKGVKLSHDNILANVRCSLPRMLMNPGDVLISYLPYTHSFE